MSGKLKGRHGDSELNWLAAVDVELCSEIGVTREDTKTALEEQK